MIDTYDKIFKDFKDYIESNSKYSPRVVKYNTNTSTYFPIVVCTLSNTISTDYCTNDKIEYYDEHYYTIEVYTKDKVNGTNITVSSQIINEELTKLSIEFFEKINMKRTLCQITPNLDTSILRRTIRYQGLIGNVRENIIRR